MFSDYKSRGFNLEDTHLEDPDRLDHMMLFMALAMYWCTDVGRRDYIENPTPTEKSPKSDRPRPLGCAQSRTQCSILVQARFAFTDSPGTFRIAPAYLFLQAGIV